jgi:hypothetical protein
MSSLGLLDTLSHPDKIKVVTLNPEMIQYMTPDLEVLKIALIQSPELILKLPENYPIPLEIQELILPDFPIFIQGLLERGKEVDPELLLRLLQASPEMIKYIPEPSPQLQLEAIWRNPDLFRELRQPAPEVVEWIKSQEGEKGYRCIVC